MIAICYFQVHSIRKLRLELREMDINLHSLMMQNVPSIELNRRLLQNQINAERFAQILNQASQSSTADVDINNTSKSYYGNQQHRNIFLGYKSSKSTDDQDIRHQNNLISNKQAHSSNKFISTQLNQDKTKFSNVDTVEVMTVNAIQLSHDIEINQQKSAETSVHAHTFAHNQIKPAPVISSKVSPVIDRESSQPKLVPRILHPSEITRLNTMSSDTSLLTTASAKTTTSSILSSQSSQPVSMGGDGSLNTIHSPVKSVNKTSIDYCPSVPPNLHGQINITFDYSDLTEASIVKQNPDLQLGGNFKPLTCVARHKIAIVIPYRDREEHLAVLLAHIHPMLQKQQLDYTVFVVSIHLLTMFTHSLARALTCLISKCSYNRNSQ